MVVLLIVAALAAALPLAWQRLIASQRLAAEQRALATVWQQIGSDARRCGDTQVLIIKANGYQTDVGACREAAPHALPAGMQLTCIELLGGRPIQRVAWHADGSATPVRCELQLDDRHRALQLSLLTGRVDLVDSRS